MSGDSPSTLGGEGFDYIDGPSSPAATTSKEAGHLGGNPPQTAATQASVLVEPPHTEKDWAQQLNSPIANSSIGGESRRNSDADKTLKIGGDKDGDDNKKPDKTDESGKKMNGVDKLDATFVPPISKKSGYETANLEDDSCCIKCLSFTMECCECTIM